MQNINELSILDAALAYAAMGMRVFPTYGIRDGKCTCGFPGCKPPNSGKHPATANGFKSGTTDETQIRAWFTNNDKYNLAIATGAGSKIYVLDIDGAQGEEALGELEKTNGKLPATLESTTGRGRHVIFRHTGEEIANSASKIGMKLDWRGDGGYIVAPPSMHYSGVRYSLGGGTLAYAPDWLMELAKGEKKKPDLINYNIPENKPNGEWDVGDVRDMLQAVDPDMDYMEWVRVGMALHEGGYPVTLWDEWSRRGKKYQAGDCIKRWRGFIPGDGVTMGTLVEKALEAGWSKEMVSKEFDPQAREVAALIHQNFIKKKTITIAESKGELTVIERPIEILRGFPDPMKVPGVVGETVKWLLSTAIKPQPELSLIHTIACLGAVFGRRYKGQGRLDTRTNIYTIGIAGTGSGKDHSRKQLSVLMEKAGLGCFIGQSQFKSDAGLVTALQKAPSQVMAIDEIGNVLQLISDKKAGGYMKNIATQLLILYSSSGGYFTAGQYADKEKEAVKIPNPNLCIYGTTTEESYAKSLTSESVASGEMNRFVVIPVSEKIPQRNENGTIETDPPQSLVAMWEALRPLEDLANANNINVTPTPTIVTWSDDIAIRFKNMGDIEDENLRNNKFGVGALWNRYRENTLKIAMILAIARNQTRPVINSQDLDVADGIVQRSLSYMTEICISSVYDSEFQRSCNKVLAYIRKEGEVAKSKISLNNRSLPLKDLNNVLEALEEQGKVDFYFDNTNPTAKKKAKIFKFVD